MSFSFWQARIVEVREEIDRVLSQSANSIHKADSIIRLLQDKYLGLSNRVYNGRNGSCSLLRCVLPISLFALLLF